MNSKQKGDKYEKEAKELLEKEGYNVERAHPKIAWIPMGNTRKPISIQHDIYGMFDLMALEPKRKIRFIQVKTNSTQGFLKKLDAWANKYPNEGITWEFWKRNTTRTPKKWELTIYSTSQGRIRKEEKAIYRDTFKNPI